MTESPHEDVRATRQDFPDDYERRDDGAAEATELSRIRTLYTEASGYHQRGRVIKQRPERGLPRIIYDISRFWMHEISVTVEHAACRDHLALERTFLGYLRTSLAVSILGILVAQLFRLQHSPTTNPVFGYFVLGIPLACICQGTAIYTLLIGSVRCWRLQHAIIRGKALTGGPEIVLLAVGATLLTLLFLALLLAIDITKEDN